MSYVAFGFPSAARIISPANYSKYVGPLTGYQYSVSVPAGGQVPGNAVKFQPPNNVEWYSREVHCAWQGLKGAGTDPIHIYPHAGGGAQPIDLSPKSNCGPSAVTMQTFTAASIATSPPPDLCGSRRHGCGCRRRRVDYAPSPTRPSPHPRIERKVYGLPTPSPRKSPHRTPAVSSKASRRCTLATC